MKSIENSPASLKLYRSIPKKRVPNSKKN